MDDAARFWIEPDLGGLECLRATYVRHRFAPHAHEEYAIGVIETGAQRVRVRGGHEIMPERTVCVINPGEQHTGHAATTAGWTYSMIYPGQSLLEDVAAQVRGKRGGVPFFKDLVLPDEEVAQRFLAFHAALRSGTATMLAKQSLFLWTLSLLIERHAPVRPVSLPGNKAKPEILRARDYLREHFADSVGLAPLAQMAGLSAYHFVRSFRTVVGLPPHAYQLHRRIAEAKRLLSLGSSISQAALATGFTDQSHLTNRFRAVLGITPGHYLKMSRNLQDSVPCPGP